MPKGCRVRVIDGSEANCSLKIREKVEIEPYDVTVIKQDLI
jgi:hypothetical protein